MNGLKQPDISERFVNTTCEKLEHIDLNSVKNEYLIFFINSATEETIPMQEKTPLYYPWHDDIIIKELSNLKDQKTAQNINSNELSKTRKK